MNDILKNVPDFSGKCLSIILIDDEVNYDLNNPYFELQGGRLFIVGTVPPGASSSDWAVNSQSAVAWDQVTNYFAFDSLEQWAKATKVSEDYEKNNKEEKKS